MSKLYVACSIAALAIAGCGQSATQPDLSLDDVTPTSLTLCGACGEEKGSQTCCAEGAEVCTECALHKGSPGCCKIEKGEDVTLCSGCGEAKGSEACCAEGAEICDCGFHKGSPACKLKKAEEETDSEE